MGGSKNKNNKKNKKKSGLLAPYRSAKITDSSLRKKISYFTKKKTIILQKISVSLNQQVDEGNYIDIIKRKNDIWDVYESIKEDTIRSIKLNQSSRDLIIINENLSNELDLIELLAKIDGEILKRGGLKTYQIASTLGQARGGDSSKKLIEWLNFLKCINTCDCTALEIGCLNSKNAISTSKIFKSVTRIDLRSQEPGLILEQNFMERPLPISNLEKFDLISCSLVLNFVPTPIERGDMLKKITKFLKKPIKNNNNMTPLLFLVLPLPCVKNSRYLNNQLLDKIMESIGFTKIKYYEAKKVAYWLWLWKGEESIQKGKTFNKKEISTSGSANKNNFCIVMK
ncbi:hypothetical protein PACTADRAFT_48646 [Pachysolen tannophilus NRRL Y-2460]|uniref:25S rRNA adenine-N(1) methyltransferase n=1 Tax=Pachysolen tannophilus NRRL Y-2460 TaxID=669874 RepID=A0A1E4TYM0_PACTA|nr:hypothetical protein PACTADRAFT_48646 [Pachysolen tannophilus NRRL Y-2460]